MHQQIRFCTARDGARLAWASHGSGSPLVKTSSWLTHLEYDWESPVWRYWLEGLGRSYSVVRYDERGCGLSDQDVGEPSVDRWVSDLETVVDAAGIGPFTLLGVSQGAAIAIAYAGASSRAGRADGPLRRLRARAQPPRRIRADQALYAAIRAGWEQPNPAFRRVFTMRFLPEGTPEQMAWYDELQRRTTSAENAARLIRGPEQRGCKPRCSAGPGRDAHRARPWRCRDPVRAGQTARHVDPEREPVAARLGQSSAAS